MANEYTEWDSRLTKTTSASNKIRFDSRSSFKVIKQNTDKGQAIRARRCAMVAMVVFEVLLRRRIGQFLALFTGQIRANRKKSRSPRFFQGLVEGWRGCWCYELPNKSTQKHSSAKKWKWSDVVRCKGGEIKAARGGGRLKRMHKTKYCHLDMMIRK